DYRNNATELDSNTILYGHNCYDTTMFSDLEKYEKIDFYKTAPVFEFNTLEKKYKWKIYGVFITSAAESEDNGYVFYYNTPNVDENDFEGFIEEVNKRRLYTTDVDINSDDRLMILSTCVRNLDLKNKAGTTTYRADGRIVILARAVRDGESADVNTEKAYVNENPKYPQLWYDKNGIQNPYKNEKGWYPQEVIR
ncbi:MAG: class B sortase, partial [Candidatus Fimenecus sp.]